YHPKNSFDRKTGAFVPISVARIGTGGSYEIRNAPIGPVQVCIATNPDVSLMELHRPTSPLASQVGPSSSGKEPPPPGRPAPPPPPGGKGTPPPLSRPGDEGFPGGQLPPGVKLPKDLAKARGNPLVSKLSDEEKQILRDIHDKYGKFGRSPL